MDSPRTLSEKSQIEEEKEMPPATSMVQLTFLQFKELCDGVLSGSMGNKSFIGCALRFNGTENRSETKTFINSLELYKKMGNISDEDALLTFPLLLTASASSWWQGLSADISTWRAAMKALQNTYAPELQPYQIYMSLFSTPQGEEEPINEFLKRKRALLAQLPPNLYSENQQLDLLYGLLKFNLRKKIMRPDIKSFDWLLERARHFEAINAELHGSDIQDIISE